MVLNLSRLIPAMIYLIDYTERQLVDLNLLDTLISEPGFSDKLSIVFFLKKNHNIQVLIVALP